MLTMAFVILVALPVGGLAFLLAMAALEAAVFGFRATSTPEQGPERPPRAAPPQGEP
ncbi:hypothetical protein [Nonomuraea sp. NPDC003754]